MPRQSRPEKKPPPPPAVLHFGGSGQLPPRILSKTGQLSPNLIFQLAQPVIAINPIWPGIHPAVGIPRGQQIINLALNLAPQPGIDARHLGSRLAFLFQQPQPKFIRYRVNVFVTHALPCSNCANSASPRLPVSSARFWLSSCGSKSSRRKIVSCETPNCKSSKLACRSCIGSRGKISGQ